MNNKLIIMKICVGENNDFYCFSCGKQVEKLPGGWVNCGNVECEQFGIGVRCKLKNVLQDVWIKDSIYGETFYYSQLGKDIYFDIDPVFHRLFSTKLYNMPISKKIICPNCKLGLMINHDGELICDKCNYGFVEMLQRV